jgi:hypothetical protein
LVFLTWAIPLGAAIYLVGTVLLGAAEPREFLEMVRGRGKRS